MEDLNDISKELDDFIRVIDKLAGEAEENIRNRNQIAFQITGMIWEAESKITSNPKFTKFINDRMEFLSEDEKLKEAWIGKYGGLHYGYQRSGKTFQKVF